MQVGEETKIFGIFGTGQSNLINSHRIWRVWVVFLKHTTTTTTTTEAKVTLVLCDHILYMVTSLTSSPNPCQYSTEYLLDPN
jgi:hypothetical protein